MAGFGGATRAETMNVAWDSWGMRVGLISEISCALVGRTGRCGSLWSGRLAIALLVPDTMELVGYSEGEPHSDWRRRSHLAWRPSLGWPAVALFVAVFATF